MPALFLPFQPIGIGRAIIAHFHRRRGALKNIKLRSRCADMRHALNGRRAGADNGDFLIGQTAQPAIGRATRIAVIPAAGMKCMALIITNTFNGGQFRAVERAIGMNNKARRQFIAQRCGDAPPTFRFLPFGCRDFGLKQGFFSQRKFFRNGGAIGQRFACIGIFLLRHKTGFFQKREINIGLNIA